MKSSLVGKGSKNSTWGLGPLIFHHFDNSESWPLAKPFDPFSVILALRLYKSYNLALRLYNSYNTHTVWHVPDPCGWVLVLGPTSSSKSPKQTFRSRAEPLSALDYSKIATEKISRRRKLQRPQQHKDCMCQCTDRLRATQNGPRASESFSTGTLLPRLLESNPYCLTHCDFH